MEKYYACINHPKNGEQRMPQPNLKGAKQWIGYMVYMHDATPLKIECPDGTILTKNISKKWN